MTTIKKISSFLVFFVALFILLSVFGKNALASCWMTSSSGTPGCGGGGACTKTGSCMTFIETNTGGICYTETDCCSTNAEATCGGGAPAVCQNGTCNNSTCATTGGCNCNDYGTQASCEGTNPVWNSTCTWNSQYGFCGGKYCCVENPNGQGCGSFLNAKSLCQGSGCNWVQGPDNTCATTSSCSLNGNACGQMQCLDSCTGGLVNDSCPTITCCTPTTCAAAGVSCGSIADGCGGTLNCGTCTCTITVSPTSATLIIGQSTTVTATVSNISSGGTLGSITWNSANSGIATVTSPGNPTTVSGISPGNTTVTATATLSPSGNCSAPAAISVYPKSWWQVSGGDVYGSNVVSTIPATCAGNCYIDLRN